MCAKYPNSLKRKVCAEICDDGNSTIKTAQKYEIPLKSLEKWITSYHKNPHCFDIDNVVCDFTFINFKTNDDDSYDDMSNDELKKLLLKKDIEIARLKKNYQVKGGGSVKKEFITLSKKNTK